MWGTKRKRGVGGRNGGGGKGKEGVVAALAKEVREGT